MKTLWDAWLQRFDALAGRERRLIGVALLGGIVLLGWSLGFDPALTRLRVAERGLADLAVQRPALQAQMAALQAPGLQPETQARAELQGLQQELTRLNERFVALESTLVPPQRIPVLLEEMIGRRSGLRLVSLRTLPVKPVLEPKSGAGAPAAGAALYKHGVEIRLEGGYAELVAYLERLEKSPQKLLWSSVTLSAEKHPRLVLTLTVFTLSLDRTWLIV